MKIDSWPFIEYFAHFSPLQVSKFWNLHVILYWVYANHFQDEEDEEIISLSNSVAYNLFHILKRMCDLKVIKSLPNGAYYIMLSIHVLSGLFFYKYSPDSCCLHIYRHCIFRNKTVDNREVCKFLSWFFNIHVYYIKP